MPEKYFKISDLQKWTNIFIAIRAPFMSIWSLRAPLLSNQRLLDAICAQMLQSFRKFPEVLLGFCGISPGLCQIKTFVGAIAAPAPRLSCNNLQKSLWQVEQQNKEHLLHAGYHLWGTAPFELGHGMQLCGVTCIIGLIAECVERLSLKIVNSFYQWITQNKFWSRDWETEGPKHRLHYPFEW